MDRKEIQMKLKKLTNNQRHDIALFLWEILKEIEAHPGEDTLQPIINSFAIIGITYYAAIISGDVLVIDDKEFIDIINGVTCLINKTVDKAREATNNDQAN